MKPSVKQNALGFWELDPKPTPEALAKFYQDQYFNSKNFEIKYDDEEYFHKQVPYIEAEFVINEYLKHSRVSLDQPLKMLDVGCGEGFSLNHFQKKGWEVAGTDYSHDGVGRHFPALKKNVVTGDTEKILKEFADHGKKFDLIILNNVLEHLLDPLGALRALRKILSPVGAVRAQVPNDFSRLQMTALEKGNIDRQFWIAPHEHMAYFNRDSLKKSFLTCGFSSVEALGDYPIDFNIMNPDSNYVMDSGRGKNCHRERIRIENLLASPDPSDLVAFRRGCGQAGVGRNIIVYGRA